MKKHTPHNTNETVVGLDSSLQWYPATATITHYSISNSPLAPVMLLFSLQNNSFYDPCSYEPSRFQKHSPVEEKNPRHPCLLIQKH